MVRTIYKLTIDDYDDLVRLWREAGLTYRPRGRDTRERIATEMQRADTAFIGIYEHDRLIGAGLATYDGRKGWINRIAVHPDFRGRGIAAQIVNECEVFLRSVAAEIISCLIEDFNKPSVQLFRKLGYVHGENVMYFSKRKSEET